MKYPLEIEGELRGAQLMVVSFPQERNLKFRLGILSPAMICRLDYTDETHTNSISGFLLRAVPYAAAAGSSDFAAGTGVASMSDHLANLISRGLDSIASITRTADGVRVTTHCMYPSNGLVQVTVRGGVETVVASDEGGAVGEALGAGIPFKDYKRMLSSLIRDEGLLIRAGVIFTPRIPIEAVSIAILHVANASQESARWLYEHMKIKRTRDFKVKLAEFLKLTFGDRVSHDPIIVGHSNKPHKFANIVSLPNGKRLIVDPAVHEVNSINSRVVANLDVRAINDPFLEQRIIFDDEEDWTPADLNLLQVGATVVPFSRSSEVIARLAASA